MKNLYFFFTVILLFQSIHYTQSPIISVDPDSINETLFAGKSSTQIITISNSGNIHLDFSISIEFFPEDFINNYALQYNGFDSYVECNDDPSLNMEQSITIEAWIYPFDWNGNRRILQKEVNDRQYQFCSEFGVLEFEVGYVNNGIIRAPLPSTNEWHHVVGLYDYDSSLSRIFVDGELVAEKLNVTGMSNTSTDPLYIGTKYPGAPSIDYFNGIIDEIRIWETARTEEQIKEKMNWELTGSENGLVGYWQFNEGSGDITYDRTSSANTGFLNGDIEWIPSSVPISPVWITVNPDSGNVTPGSLVDIDVNFNALGLIGDEYNANIKITSNDPVTPELIVPVHLSVTDAPAIWVQTDDIDFGEVFLGITDKSYLEVKNIGSQDLLIFNTTIQPTEYTVSPTFAGIDPGENEIFTVTFNPTVVGSYPGMLTLNSNDPLYGNYVINLSGQGVEPPVIVVYPDSLVVGVLPGSTRTKILTISNEGGSNLYFNVVARFSSINYALQFDGVDDYIQIADHTSLNMFNSSVSISAWIKSSSNYSHETMIFEHDVWSNPGTYQLTSMNSNTLRFNFPSMEWNEGALDYYVDYTDGNWHHVVGMLDSDDNEARIYYDGYLVASKSVSSEIGTATALTYIGSRGGDEMFFDGIIDEVRLWNTARSQSEIQEFMHKKLTGTEPGLVAYWQFDEGVGDIAFDKTINENHGTLFGGVLWTEDTAPIIKTGWLQMNTDSGFCSPHTSIDIELLFDATEVDVDTGDYYASIILISNDPFNPSVVVPIHMIVSSSVGVEDGLNTPLTFNLYQNYPNPFNPVTTIKYSIPELSKVKLTLFNLLGEEVTTLVNEEIDAGNYSVEFNAVALPSGVYFYQLRADNYVETKKMILLR